MEIVLNGSETVCVNTYATFFVEEPEGTELEWEIQGEHEVVQEEEQYHIRWFHPGIYIILITGPGIEPYEHQVEVMAVPDREIIGVKPVYPGYTHTYFLADSSGGAISWSIENGNILTGEGTDKVEVSWADNPSQPKRLTVSQILDSHPCTAEGHIDINLLSLSSNFTTKRENLKISRISRDDAIQLLYEYKETLALKQGELEELLRIVPAGNSSEVIALQGEVSQLNEDIEYQEKVVFSEKESARNRHQELCGGNHSSQVSNLSDSYPLILFPIKIETKFHGGPEAIYKLKVRIYPDDIEVENHEKELTAQETDAGNDYWNEVNQTSDYDEQVGAWNAIATKYSPQRAAWIVLKTDPNLPPGSESGEKSTSWTRQQEARILPDKFIITVYHRNALDVTYFEVGQVETNVVPDRLKIGIDPTDEESLNVEGPTDDKVIKLGGEAAWMQDFDEAVNKGMATEILMNSLSTPLSNSEVENGYLKLVIAGVKVSEDETRTKDLLEANLNDHHYTGDGFGILKIGTPTSNSTKKASGFNTPDNGNYISHRVERESQLFTSTSNFVSRSDGQRLAEAFGIDDEVLHHIVNSDSKDIKSAITMNDTLSGMLLGKTMKDMWGNVFNMSDIDSARYFFIRYVIARGILPTIRVGNQPYGVLPVTAFGSWVNDNADPEYPFLNGLKDTLDHFNNIVDGVLDNVATVNPQGSQSKQEAVLHALSQQPVSSELYQRHALGPEAVYNTMSFNDRLETAQSWYSNLESDANSKKASLGLDSEVSAPRGLKLSYYQDEGKVKKPLIQEGRLSDTQPVKNMPGKSVNYLEWLSTASYAEIKDEDFGEGLDEETRPKVMMFDMAKHSVLQEYWFAAYKLLTNSEVEVQWAAPEFVGVPEAGSTELPQGISAEDALTGGEDPWAIMDEVNENLHSELTVAEYIDSLNPGESEELADLESAKNALSELSNMPSASVDLLVHESLDLASYRIDGWQLGMVNQRLEKMRYDSSGNRVYGSYVGAYGLVEDLQPASRSYLSSGDAAQIDGIEEPIERDPKGHGFIHAPSMNHASAAAVLKSSYDPIKDKGWDNAHGYPKRINLNSGRVRKALKFVQGMNAGQDLNGLLGYEFERALHESTYDLDQYVYTFRDAFPLGQLTELNGNPQSAVQAGSVVDGLKLYQATRGENSEGSSYPYNISGGLPTSGSNEANEIEKVLDLLSEIMDSIHDLAISEATYHLMEGNPDAASGIMQALEKGKPLPIDYEVLKTPRTGSVLNQKLSLHIDPSGNAAEWGAPATVRSTAEPALNKWLAAQIPDPEAILCMVEVNGYTTAGDDLITESNVSLADLDIQPIDFIAILNSVLKNDDTELSKRIRHFVRTDLSLTAGSKITIDYGTFIPDETPPDAKSFYEILPFARKLRSVITESRHLRPDDYLIGYEIDQDSLSSSEGFDLSELETRLDYLLDQMGILRDNLSVKYADINDPGYEDSNLIVDLPILRGYLLDLAAYGIQSTVPEHANENNTEAKAELLQLAEVAITTFTDKYNQANAHWNTYTSPSNLNMDDKELAVRKLDEIMKLVFDKSFRIIPRFTFYNPSELENSVSDWQAIIPSDNPLAVEEVITSVSAVRNKVATWDMCRMLGESVYGREENVIPVQLPYASNDFWYALPHPEAPDLSEDKFSFIMHLPDPPGNYDVNSHQAGLMLDEWVENIPSKDVGTGLAFHKNQPGAKAPNCVLVAVPPQETGTWHWDDVLETINQTYRAAQRRTVDSNLLGGTHLTDLTSSLIFTNSGSISDFKNYFD